MIAIEVAACLHYALVLSIMAFMQNNIMYWPKTSQKDNFNHMTIDLTLKKIAIEALETFPPHDTGLGKDLGTASNYAQRMLTKHISEIRKSGQIVSDEDTQEQRQLLDGLINSLDVPAPTDSDPIFNNADTDNNKIENEAPETPLHLAQLTAIISACFHTPTDGSAKHLAFLRSRARGELNQYLNDANIGWTEKRHLKSKGKRLIDIHMKDINQKNGTTKNKVTKDKVTENGDAG